MSAEVYDIIHLHSGTARGQVNGPMNFANSTELSISFFSEIKVFDHMPK